MATRRYSVDPGKALEDVVEAAGAAVATKAIEITIDCASTVVVDGATTRKITKEEVLFAIEQFEMYIIRGNWPPV